MLQSAVPHQPLTNDDLAQVKIAVFHQENRELEVYFEKPGNRRVFYDEAATAQLQLLQAGSCDVLFR